MNKRVKSIKPSVTLALNQKARDLSASGREILNLTAGEPDFHTPKNIQDAAIEAIQNGKNFYSPASGIAELREAVAKISTQDYKRNISPSQIVISGGAKQALFNYFFSVLEPGDEVILFAPYWVTYVEVVRMCGGTPVIVDTSNTHFVPTLDQLKKQLSPRTKVVVFNSPCNPTGVVYPSHVLSELAVLLNERGVQVLSDDIYQKLVYGNDEIADSIGAGDRVTWDKLTIVNGVSKTYSMTGWRLGWTISSDELSNSMSKIQSQMNSGTSTISQWAALEAISGDQSQVHHMREAFKLRKEKLFRILNDVPLIKCQESEGAFYAFANIEGVIEKLKQKGMKVSDDISLCEYWLDELNIAVVPGSAFGAPGFFRMSFATSDAIIEQAALKIKDFCLSL